MNELNQEIVIAQMKMNETPKDDPDERVKTSSFLACLLLERFMQTTLPPDLKMAIELLEDSINGMNEDYPKKTDVLYNYGAGLLMRFRINKSSSLVSKILWAFENALLSAPTDYAMRPTMLKVMGDLLLDETFRQTQSLAVLDRAIELYKESLHNVRPDNSFKGDLYTNLGVAFQERFRQTGRLEELEQAVEAKEAAVKYPQDNEGLRAKYLCNLGNAYRDRFHHNGILDDLHRAVAVYQEALEMSSKVEGVVSLDDRSGLLQCLGTGLQARFAVTRSASDLDGAIGAYSEAIKFAGEDHRPAVLCNIGNAFLSRYAWGGGINDFNLATAALDEALQGRSDEQSRTMILSNVSSAVLLNFKSTGSTEDLNRAIAIADETVKITTEQHILRESMLYTLSEALYVRYLRFHAIEDLNGAMASMEVSLEKCENETYRGSRYGTLAMYLRDRYNRTSSMQDLESGLSLCARALTLLQPGSSGIPRLHSILGTLLVERFRSRGIIQDLNMAIASQERALRHDLAQERPKLLWNLGSSLKIRFECSNDTEDLEGAIDCFKEALAGVEIDNSNKAKYLINLRLLQLQMSTETSAESVSHFESAVACSSAVPFDRLIAAARAVQILSPIEADAKCRLLTRAVELLPLTSPSPLRQPDQQYLLSQFPHMASAAAAYALQTGKSPTQALTLLEIGRGVIATHRMQINPDLDSLQRLYPAIAEEFTEARDKFEVPPGGPEKMFDFLDLDITRRHSSASEFESVVDRIRQLKGFERFLLGLSEEEAKNIAAHGPLVVLNVSELRCDAIIVSSDSVRSLNLPSLRYAEVRTNAKALIGALTDLTARTYHSTNTLLTQILEWLWDAAVGPTLSYLGYRDIPSKDAPWPHVCWITVGWLSLFPLHGAGYNCAGSSRTALDRVISSYSPTLKTLTYSAQKGRTNSANQHAVLVSMAQTPGRKDLPQALDEVDLLNDLLPAAVEREVLTTPTKSEVLSKLETCTMAHFACHGHSTPDDPSQSYLLLADWQNNPMTIGDIQSLRRKGLSLAYLSACQTANSRYDRLLDEGINIATGFLLAGFPSVIGTLWNVEERFSLEIAKHVYSVVLDAGKLDVYQASRGLHFAQRSIRDEQLMDSRFKTSDPLAWAGFIHVGVYK